MARINISVHELHQRLIYDAENGVFAWQKKQGNDRITLGWNAKFLKREAGTIDPTNGYKKVSLSGVYYYCHRIAMAMFHGRWPEHEVDHINGVRSDNRIVNLRFATRRENAKNTRTPITNTSGHAGVTLSKSGTWCARIYHENKAITLGTFADKDQAISARKMAEVKYGYIYRPPNPGPLQACLVASGTGFMMIAQGEPS